MEIVQLLLICLLSYAAGDISEKLRQGQAFSGPGPSSDFGGLLAPFQDNVKSARLSGTKGGRPSGIKGGAQLGAGATNPTARVPIPFGNHDGDDDENNLDRLCNDAFHSFLCKPVGPRKFRFDGNLRPGAQIPPGVIVGSSSNLQFSQKAPALQKSGGALLPTELDNEEGNPTNNVFSSTGYSYPKPQYTYDKPTNQLAYPSQISAVESPSNEYLPAFVPSTTTPRPIVTSTAPTTFIFTSPPPTTPRPIVTNFAPLGLPSNQIQNPSPIFTNQISYNYPKPSNPIQLPAASSISNTGYSYPKPEYNYEKPANQLAYPSQVAPAIQKPSNEYLPAPTVTTPAPQTSTRPPPPVYTFTPTPAPITFSPQVNQIPLQSNPQPVLLNQLFYEYSKPNIPLALPAASQSFPLVQQPLSYSPPQTFFPSSAYSFIPSSPAQDLSFLTLSTSKPYSPLTFAPTTTISQPRPTFSNIQPFPQLGQASNVIGSTYSNQDNGYFYPKPTNTNPVVLPISTTPAPPPTRPPNREYLPPIGAPVPKESINVFSSVQLPSSTPRPFTSPSSTLRIPVFQSTTPRPLLTFPTATPSTTLAPIRIIPSITTPRPFFTTRQPTTSRPFTFRPAPLVAVTTLRPFVQITQTQTTARPFLLPSSSFQPQPFNFAATNNQIVSAPFPQRPNNGYLPPPNQPIPSPANEFPSVLPANQITFRPFPTTTTPRPPPPPPPPPPSKEYLPQIDIRSGSSSNLSPNFQGGGLLAEEADAPSPNFLSPKSTTTERTHTLEEFCRDAFHSFLCKPIDKPRRRIDGKIRAGAKLPPNVLIGAGSAPAVVRRPSFSGSALLPTQLDPSRNVFKPFNPAPSYYAPTNLNPRVSAAPSVQPSFFLLSESDSSSLAKHFSNSKNALPDQRLKSDSSIKRDPSTPPTTVSPSTAKAANTTPKPSRTTTQRYTTSKELRASLVAAGSAIQQSTDFNSPSAARKNGYKYPKPSKPFTYPTTSSGYNYPKPKKEFTTPSTSRPQTSPRSTFGQRLRPKDLNNGQKQFQQQEQFQFREDPFGREDEVQRNNELPPASQFEILKP